MEKSKHIVSLEKADNVPVKVAHPIDSNNILHGPCALLWFSDLKVHVPNGRIVEYVYIVVSDDLAP